jgi:hypothetical protein
VVVQDTGFSDFLPTGAGLMAFSDAAQAIEAVRQVAADYNRHQRAALEIARECFAADRVIGNILARAGLQ